MSRVLVKATEARGRYIVAATRGEYVAQVRHQPQTGPCVPARDYVVCVDGTRNGDYGWHQVGRISADSAPALAAAFRSGDLMDLREIAP